MSIVTCSHCQTENPEKSEFCGGCGRLLKSGASDRQNALPNQESTGLEMNSKKTEGDSAARHDVGADSEEELLDWLISQEPTGRSQGDAGSDQTSIDPVEMEEALPDWVSELIPLEEWPDPKTPEQLAGKLADLEQDEKQKPPSISELPKTSPLSFSRELKGVPARLAGAGLPNWLGEGEADEEAEDAEEDGPAWPVELEGRSIEAALDELLGLEEKPTTSKMGDEWKTYLDEPPAEEAADEGRKGPMADLDLGELSEPPVIPDWLGHLETDEIVLPYVQEADQTAESSGPLVGLSGVLQTAQVVAEPRSSGRASEYTVTAEQRRQVSLLRQLTLGDVQDASETEVHQKAGSISTTRLVLGFSLLLTVLIGWLVPSIGDFLPAASAADIPSNVTQAYDLLDKPTEDVVLVAFEYTPATAGELDRVAETLLGHLAERGHSLVTVSQVAAGLFLADRIGEGFDGLAVHPLGFLPGESAGLRLLGGCLADSANCDVIAELADHEAVMEDLQQIGLIVVLTGERDSLVNWLEQVGTQTEVPIVAGITQSLAPIASPYLASGQLSAVVDGFPSALAYGRLSGNGEEVESTSTDKQMAAYILAQWLVIIIFVIGVLYYRLAGLIPTKMKKREP